MRTVDEATSACGGFRLTHSQEVGPGAIASHAVLARAADGAVLLDLTDPGCRVDACFFDAAKAALLHVVVSRVDGSLLAAHFVVDLAAGTWEVHDGGRDEPWRGDLAGLQAIARGAPLAPAPSPCPPPPVDVDALLPFLPPVGSPSDVVRTFGELELAPGRRYRVLLPLPDYACRGLAVGDEVTFLRSGFSARDGGYQLQFAGGPRRWFELRLSDDDPRDRALLGSLQRHFAPAADPSDGSARVP